jgi:pimeloyl-ACP methyl ester carboxylesterase
MAITASVPAYEITTRGNLEAPRDVQGDSYNRTYRLLDIDQLKNTCPSEILIFVHGWGLTESKAKERFDRIKMSLEHNNYSVPIIGFSWDSSTSWPEAKVMAKENGPKLAQFIADYKDECKNQHNKDSKIRLIGHSMGSRVVLSTLANLNKDSTWNNIKNNFTIESVHLLGAAVDDEEISMESIDHFNPPESMQPRGVKFAYGPAIEQEVVRFYNLFDPEDNVLQFIYPYFEDNPFFPMSTGGDRALGENGKQKSGIIPPSNYNDTNVRTEIIAADDADGDAVTDDGICILDFCSAEVGDNHGGYIGYRNADGSFRNDGAINVVVAEWKK